MALAGLRLRSRPYGPALQPRIGHGSSVQCRGLRDRLEHGGPVRVFKDMTRARKTVLLVDHDLYRRLRLGNAILRRRWRLRIARSGGEGLDLLSFYSPLVILVDSDLLRIFSRDLVMRMHERAPDAAIVGLADREHEGEVVGVDIVLPRTSSLALLFETMDNIFAQAEQRLAEAVEESPRAGHLV